MRLRLAIRQSSLMENAQIIGVLVSVLVGLGLCRMQ